MAPKKARAKTGTSAAPTRRSRRLAGADAEIVRTGSSGTETNEQSEDDPERILRRQRQRRQRTARNPSAGVVSGARVRKSVGGREASKARPSAARASHHETGQLHLPPAATANAPSGSQGVSEASTPAAATIGGPEEAPTPRESPATQNPATRGAQEESEDAVEQSFGIDHQLQVSASRDTQEAAAATTEDPSFPPLQANSNDGTASDNPTEEVASRPEVETGAEDENSTAEGAQAAEVSQSSPEKRSSEDSIGGDSGTKRPSIDSDAQPEEGDQRIPRLPSSNPCLEYQALLSRLRSELDQAAATLESPAVLGQNLYIDMIFRAIAAVTEAVVENRGPLFALIDSNTALSRGGQDIARPGQTLYYPYATGGRSTDFQRTPGGHLALFVFDVAHPHGGTGDDGEGANISVDRYDSSPTPDEYRVYRAYGEARNVLEQNNWIDHSSLSTTTGGFPDFPQDQPAPRQTRNWVCGLHVIFNAWVHALGLQPMVGRQFGGNFYRDGVAIVNLALLGLMDANTIRNFLACHFYINRESEVPPDRVFNQTYPFRSTPELALHVARVRLRNELDERATQDPSTPNLNRALEEIRQIRPSLRDDQIIGWTTSDLMQHYRQAIQATDPLYQEPPAIEGQDGETLERARTTSLQQELRRAIFESDIDTTNLSLEDQQLLADMPLDRMSEIQALVDTLPRRRRGDREHDEPPSTEVSPTTTVPSQSRNLYTQGDAPSRFGPIPGLLYDIDPESHHAQPEPGPDDHIWNGSSDHEGSWSSEDDIDQTINTGDRSPDLPTPPPAETNTSTPGCNDEEEQRNGYMYRPPFESPHESTPYDPETPGVDEAELVDYRPTDSDLEREAEAERYRELFGPDG